MTQRIRKDVPVLMGRIEDDGICRMRRDGEDRGGVDAALLVETRVSTEEGVEPDDVAGNKADEDVE
jgi:hypothetical protein